MAKFGFDIRQFILNDSFFSIEEYLKIAIESYTKEQELYKNKTQKYIDSLKTDNDESLLNDEYQKMINNRDVIFFTKLYYSLVIMIYSSIETNLFMFCDYIKNNNNYSVDVNDLHGNGIYKCRKYLEKVCRIDFNIIDKEWTDICILNKIRNGIIHNNGKITKNDIGKIQNYIVERKVLLVLESDEIIAVSKEYLVYIITKSRKALEKLYLLLVEKDVLTRT